MGRRAQRTGRMAVCGGWGHTAHLFTLMTLQTPNSVHTLELDRGTETEVRGRAWVGSTELLGPSWPPGQPLSPSLVVCTLTPRGPGYPRGP